MERSGDLVFQFHGQEFILTPEKGSFWKKLEILIVSDLHLGKAGHFRKAGIPVSEEVNEENFARMDNLIDHFKPQALLFLGDLFHSEKNIEWNAFENWRDKRSNLRMILILGNHDFYALSEYRKLGLECHNSLKIKPFNFVHELPDKSGSNKVFIGGHIHPSVKIKGLGRQSVKAPCFYFHQNKAVLPAFGKFTGTHNIKPVKNSYTFPIVENQVLKL